MIGEPKGKQKRWSRPIICPFPTNKSVRVKWIEVDVPLSRMVALKGFFEGILERVILGILTYKVVKLCMYLCRTILWTIKTKEPHGSA